MADGGHVAIVTGANHGIGAATAISLARRGVGVVCTYLRLDDPADPGTPDTYRQHRQQDARRIVAEITADGGAAVAVEADLCDPLTPARLFDAAEEQLGHVDVLVTTPPAGFKTASHPGTGTDSVVPWRRSAPVRGHSSSPSTRWRLPC